MAASSSEQLFRLPPMLRDALAEARTRGETILVRIPEPNAPREPWDLANAVLWSGERAALWSDPNGALTAVGLFELETIRCQGATRFAELESALSARQARTRGHAELLQLPLWFGGFAFDGRHNTPNAWEGWSAAEATTHRICFVKTPQRSYAVLSLLVEAASSEQELHDEYSKLRNIVQTLRSMEEDECPTPLQFQELDAQQRWNEKIAQIHDEIGAGKLQKLVLARRVFAPWAPQSDTPLGVRLCQPLRAMRQRYGHCTTFALVQGEDHGNTIFFGSTPELLVASQGQEFQTMALAGTMPRGDTSQEDKAQTMRLLASPKEREEHAFVVQDIVQSLENIGLDVQAASAPDVATFRNVHHLQTSIRAQSQQRHGVLSVAAALHPTPAICGTPTEAAFDWIAEHENIQRGWYSGGVFWLNDLGHGRVNVALRSALASEQGILAFAGAGIVEGSNADKEWEETFAKLSPVCDAFDENAIVPTLVRGS